METIQLHKLADWPANWKVETKTPPLGTILSQFHLSPILPLRSILMFDIRDSQGYEYEY
jgi:hypothetical protein